MRRRGRHPVAARAEVLATQGGVSGEHGRVHGGLVNALEGRGAAANQPQIVDHGGKLPGTHLAARGGSDLRAATGS